MTTTALDAIHQTFTKWLTLPSTDVLDMLAGTVIANRLAGPPIFLVVVGPSGSGKSEFIDSLGGLDNIHPISTLTPRTFLSGLKGKAKEASLLMQLNPKQSHILTFKDLTTVFSQRADERVEILAQLREIYDGSLVKSWGTGEKIAWKGKIGVIAGCTGVYDEVAQQLSALGERFLVYRPSRVDSICLAEHAMRATEADRAMKAELQRAMKTLDGVKPVSIPLSYDVRQYLSLLCDFLAHLRTPIRRDRYTREVIQMPEFESTGRLAKQFTQLIRGLTIVRGEAEPGEAEVGLIDQVAVSSVPSLRLKAIVAMPLEGTTLGEMKSLTGIPESTCHRLLQDLELLRLVERPGGRGWTPSPQFKMFFAMAQRIVQ